MIYRAILFSALLLFLAAERNPAQGGTQKPVLVQAVVCEDVRDGSCRNQGAVFSVTVGGVACYTAFDPVPGRTVIYHNWYRKDELNAKIRLVLQPPRWATFSSIQLREIDKGPWRIEITDQEDRALRTLRFSITD